MKYILITLAMVGLAACGQSEEQPTKVSTPSSLSSEVSAEDGLNPSSLGLSVGDDGGQPADKPESLTPRVSADAKSRAAGFLQAFGRSDLSQAAWWSGVAGFFTPASAPIYESVDVANVPFRRVDDSSAKIRSGTTQFRALVDVKTDSGWYTVVLLWADETWFVDRYTPVS
ncbi:MAG: hypothetical protein ACRC0L_13055 [Angustibacter sp.]